ncbi:putative MFS family arabinose efflux permease [Microbacterium sp. BK668]|nr:putative MFS family arabinose efflux permease [Microbacterium sp. BK668]
MSSLAGFWVVAAVFTTVTAYATIPTPLYPLYQAQDRFPVPIITLIFAAFAVGVVFSLFFIGHVSDWAGRRRMTMIAVATSALAAIVFLTWNAVPGLVVGRFVDGVSVGTLTAAATAHLAELRRSARPNETAVIAASVAGAANLGGLALGPLIGGLFAEFLPDPLELPHAVFLVLFVAWLPVILLVPETIDPTKDRPAYRPQRLAFPPGGGSAFAAAGVGAAASFALFALFTSLAPTFMHQTFRVTDPLADGAAVFAVFGAAALAQIVLVGVAQRTQLTIAVVCFAVGLAAIAVGALLPALPLFLVGGIIGGAAAGIMFRAAIASAAALARPDRRGETLALLFLIAYTGLVVPVLLVGVSLAFVGEITVLLVFTAFVLVATVGAGVVMRGHSAPATARAQRQGSSGADHGQDSAPSAGTPTD